MLTSLSYNPILGQSYYIHITQLIFGVPVSVPFFYELYKFILDFMYLAITEEPLIYKALSIFMRIYRIMKIRLINNYAELHGYNSSLKP
ncbi:hypothetical protein CLOL250_01499 [Clostridium sp. L2-50]|nr:hypothetical protein CLOL250_01499 [Clostridium sp. L2-50]